MKKRYGTGGRSIYIESSRGETLPLVSGRKKTILKSNYEGIRNPDDVKIRDKSLHHSNVKNTKAQSDEEKNPENNYFIYMITLEEELCRMLAKRLKEPMYNSYLHYNTHFNENMINNYEPFRDTQVQGFLMKLFSEEFDIHQLKSEGYIIDHFPTHHFSERKRITQFWKESFLSTLFSPLSSQTKLTSFRPITQLAFYHGIQVGYLFKFLITYTSWILPLGIILLLL